MSDAASIRQRVAEWTGQSLLFMVTSLSTFAVFFIFYFIFKDALPFFKLEGIKELFTGAKWYPSQDPEPAFGALSLFAGTGLVTLGAIIVAVPLGVSAAVCLSDLLPFKARQIVKPVIEMLAAIPSVAYGFFAIVVFAPLLQEKGGSILATGTWLILGPIFALLVAVLGDLVLEKLRSMVKLPNFVGFIVFPLLAFLAYLIIHSIAQRLSGITINSGTNALNASIILGIMALPTIVSVSEDALQATGRELREGSYALGATRAETIMKTIIPASASGIFAAVILGIMRAIGETMVVLMASGNAAKIPEPWYNFLEPIRTLTATIAADMGEADHVTGSSRFHVLFALALCLLTVSFFMNLASEIIVKRSRKKLGK